MNRRFLLLGWVMGIGFCAGPTDADVWTNAAGFAIQAQAVAFDGEQVTLRQADGRQLMLPLHALAPDEQIRLKRAYAMDDLPAGTELFFRQAQRELERVEARRSDPMMSTQEFETRRTAILQSFILNCQRQGTATASTDLQMLLQRLTSEVVRAQSP